MDDDEGRSLKIELIRGFGVDLGMVQKHGEIAHLGLTER